MGACQSELHHYVSSQVLALVTSGASGEMGQMDWMNWLTMTRSLHLFSDPGVEASETLAHCHHRPVNMVCILRP